MSAAARLSDPCDHGGLIATGSPTVTADGLPVARTGDILNCFVHGPQPLFGTASTIAEGQPRVRVGDFASCGAVIIAGSPTVDLN